MESAYLSFYRKALVTSMVLAGCGAPFTNAPFEDDARFLSALPDRETLEVGAPDAQAARESVPSKCRASGNADSSGEQGARSDASGSDDCDPDTLRVMTYDTVTQMNAYVADLLEVLDAIRSHPPTTRTEDSRIWGPVWSDSLSAWMRLEVVWVEPVFQYALSLSLEAEDAGDPLLYGRYQPGSTADEGQGSFTFDFTTRSTYHPDTIRTGTMDVIYDTRGEGLELEVEGHALGQEGNSTTIDESYAYSGQGDGSGSFYFSKPVDVYGDEAVLEQASIWGIWQADGQGRSDLEFQGGDLGAYQATATECWSAAQTPTWSSMAGCDPVGSSDTCLASAKGWNEL